MPRGPRCIWHRSWAVLLILAGAPTASAGTAEAALESSVEIPFLTTRRVEESADGPVVFTTDVGDLSAGQCEVILVSDDAMEATNGDVVAVPIDQVMERFADRTPPGILVYIHGYNIGLNRACRDAARLARATGFDDRTLLFSWPASRTLVTYRKDEDRLTKSIPTLIDAIHDLAAHYGYDNINIVAHSMGSRAVLALADSPRGPGTSPDAAFANIILVAPDVEREKFIDAAPRLQQRARNISILVSEDDKLLMLSRIVNQDKRLGQDSELAVAGVKVVDVSDMEDLGLTGHIYHLENHRIGDLLRQILGTPAENQGRRSEAALD